MYVLLYCNITYSIVYHMCCKKRFKARYRLRCILISIKKTYFIVCCKFLTTMVYIAMKNSCTYSVRNFYPIGCGKP